MRRPGKYFSVSRILIPLNPQSCSLRIPAPARRRTVCISSQVGCAVGCRFCATGQQGFVRNLSAGEIIGQILFFLRRFREQMPAPVKGKNRAWLTNVVFMGMGEPLANYDNVRQAIAILNSPKAMGMGFIRLRCQHPVWFRKSVALLTKICNFSSRFPSTLQRIVFATVWFR